MRLRRRLPLLMGYGHITIEQLEHRRLLAGDSIAAEPLLPASEVMAMEVSAEPAATADDVALVTHMAIPQHLVSAGKYVYFLTGSSTYEVWRSDGSAEGTVKLATLGRSSGIGALMGWDTATYQDHLVFFIEGTLYITDGTPENTRELASYGSFYAGFFAEAGNRVFFHASDAGQVGAGGEGGGLWVIEGDPANVTLRRVGDMNTFGWTSSQSELLAAGNVVYYMNGPDGDSELWRSDGTEAGTYQVAEVHPTDGSRPRGFMPTGSSLSFMATGPDLVPRLYTTADGGSAPVKAGLRMTIDSQSRLHGQTASIGGIGYFLGQMDGDAGTFGLWRTDGTEAGTYRVSAVPAPARQFTVVGDRLYFTADGQLWTSDGTAVGTQQLSTDLNGDTYPERMYIGNGPERLTAVNGRLYFVARSTSAQSAGIELYTSDGTVAGTKLVTDLNPSGNGLYSTLSWIRRPLEMTAHGDTLFFAGHDGTAGGLWKLNPPAPVDTTTTYLSDLAPISASAPFGGVWNDRSPGNTPIMIGGVAYAKGVGVHSPSEVIYDLGGKYTRFTAAVGIGDHVGNSPIDGSAQFMVYVDGVLKHTSSRRDGSQPAELIDVDLTGAKTLRLVTNTGGRQGDNDYKDHGIWADAKLTSGPVVTLPTLKALLELPMAREASTGRGMIWISRGSAGDQPLPFSYSVAGSATNGIDYALLSGHGVIPAGAAGVMIYIDAIDDDAYEGDETVVITISPTSDYLVDPAGASATVTIVDNDQPAVQSVYLSDLDWTRVVSPYGGARKDASVGGKPMMIGGVAYAKGVGVHSPSELVYDLGGKYTRFTAAVGVDDSVGNSSRDGSAQFMIYVDGVLKKTSSRRDGSQAAELIDVDIAGAQTLRLVTNTGGLPGDNDYKDHANWADATLHTSGAPQPGKPEVSISAVAPQVHEDGLQNGRLRIQRTGDLSQELSVGLLFSGQAIAGEDYHAPQEVVIPAGQAAVEHDIIAIDDDRVEGDESFAISIQPNGTYVVGGAGTASFVVVDDDRTQPPTGSSVWVSDLHPVSVVSPYIGFNKDRSAGLGPLTIGGKQFAKGLAVHAHSQVVYELGGQYSRFTSFVGIDDFVGNGSRDGSAVFQVYVDDVLVASSSRQTGAMAGEAIEVDVTGGQVLKLVTTTGGDNDYKDHTDWADARLYLA